MNFSAMFIHRPIATSLLMLGIGMFGVVAYTALPVSDLPNVDFPTITVSAQLPGASPSTMASAVATPLERQFTTIAGIDSMTSTNSLGSTSITMQFDLKRDIDGATVDVQTAIAAAMSLLPPGMPSPPSFRRVNPSDSPIMFLMLTSETLPLSKLNEYADTTIGQRISTIPGVAQVNVMGAQKYAVHVKVDPDALAVRKIGINEVAQALRDWNVNQPVGTVWGNQQAFNLKASGQLMNAEAFRPLIVAWRNNAPVRLDDIADVKDTVEDERTSAYTYSHDPNNPENVVEKSSLNLMVMRQPGSNVVEVNDAIARMIPQIRQQLPPAVVLELRGDRSKTIREAFEDVKFTMGLTVILVVLVIFVFLRNASATLIPAMALPFSILGTFAVMYVMDFSLDNLSMMALILCVGFVVDDAIVMLENIVRHIEMGESPMEAALLGSQEIWFTILSMTISLTAVFIPVLFMGGVLGRLFREFAVTISVAVLFSGFISMTLTPMLCSRLLRSTHGVKHGWLYRVIEGSFTNMLTVYRHSLEWTLRYKFLMVIVFFGMIGTTGWLFTIVPTGFIPDTDNDQLYVNTEVAQGTAFPELNRMQRRMARIVAADPDVEGAFSSAGGSMFGASSTNGRFFVTLKPRRNRVATAQQIAERLRPKLQGFPGIRAFVSLPPAIRIGGRGSRSSFEYTLQSTDTATLLREAPKFERELARLPIVQEVNSDQQARSPRLTLEINRDKAGSYGLNVLEIQNSLYNAYGPSWVSTIYGTQAQYRVVLEVAESYQAYGDMLSRLFLKASNGSLIPLQAIATLKPDAGPQSISHSGQLPSVTVSFNLKPGVALGQAVEQVQELANQTLPADMNTAFSGTAKVFQDSIKNLGLLLFVAIMVVYIVLGVLYESFIHPITILSGLPSAGFGALLTIYLFKLELSIYAFVGLIMLIGIVKKNAIMQIDFALDLERRLGMPSHEAILAGCLARFRPILMTSAAALFGTLPLALGFGAGGEARRPLGMAVVGGLVFSQLLTLYLTPVVYLYMEKLSSLFSRNKKAAGPLPAPVEAHS